MIRSVWEADEMAERADIGRLERSCFFLLREEGDAEEKGCRDEVEGEKVRERVCIDACFFDVGEIPAFWNVLITETCRRRWRKLI